MVDSHETLFDDRIYDTFITAKVVVFFGICNVGIQGGDATISIRASRLDWCDRLAVSGNGGTANAKLREIKV